MMPKYPEIHVDLSEQDGNGFFIIGRVSKALRCAAIDRDEIKKFQDQAMSGDYNHLLRTVMDWVSVS